MTDKARLAALEAVAMALLRHIEGDDVTRDLITDDEWAGYLSDADYVSGLIFAAGYAVEQGWQPIETAPRDGTEVLLWCVPGRHSESEMGSIFAALWWDVAGPEDDPDGDWIIPLADDKEGGWGSGAFRWEPTHWRPLTAPRDCRPPHR